MPSSQTIENEEFNYTIKNDQDSSIQSERSGECDKMLNTQPGTTTEVSNDSDLKVETSRDINTNTMEGSMALENDEIVQESLVTTSPLKEHIKTFGVHALQFPDISVQAKEDQIDSSSVNPKLDNVESDFAVIKDSLKEDDLVNSRSTIEEAKRKQSELQKRLEETRQHAMEQREKLKFEQEKFETDLQAKNEHSIAEHERRQMQISMKALELGLEMEKENIPPMTSTQPERAGFFSARKACGKRSPKASTKKGKSFGGLSFRDQNINRKKEDKDDNQNQGFLKK